MSHAKVFKLTGIACQSQLISCSSFEPDAWVPLADHCEEVKALKMERIYDLNQIGGLQEENARLKAEVERLRASSFVTAVPVEQYEKLKAEVERLRNLGIKLDGYVDLVRHENERLRKAGDAVCESPYLLETDPAVIAWRAAKEGKPSV